MEFFANEGKNVEIEVNGKTYLRHAIKTRFVKQGENYIDIFTKIISSLNVKEVKNNIKENYDKIINDNDKRKNKMIEEFKKIISIYKENPELKFFCDDLIS